MTKRLMSFEEEKQFYEQYRHTITNVPLLRACVLGLAALAAEGPSDTSYGVCYNLRKETHRTEAYVVVAAAAYTWAYTVWSCGYPSPYFVPHDKGSDLWEGRDLELRQDLIQHCIACFTEWLAEMGEEA